MRADELYEVRFDPGGDDFNLGRYELPKSPLTLRHTGEQLEPARLSGGGGSNSGTRFEIVAGELRTTDGSAIGSVFLIPRDSGRGFGAGASVSIFAMAPTDRLEPVARACLWLAGRAPTEN